MYETKREAACLQRVRRLVGQITLYLCLATAPSLYADETVLHWVGCGISKKSYMTSLAKAYEEQTGIKIDVAGGGATKGIRDVASITADLGGSCRRNFRTKAEEANAVLVPVAWDALAVIVHPDNPVDNITLDQLQAVLLGETGNWKELGGSDAAIDVYVRAGKISGVGHTLRTLVFNDKDLVFTGADEEFPSSGPLEKAVEQGPNSVGVTGISSARKRNVKILRLEGKDPTYENVRDGKYLLYRPLYLVYNKESPNAEQASAFIQFAQTDAGREAIRSSGTLPYMEGLSLMTKRWNTFRASK